MQECRHSHNISYLIFPASTTVARTHCTVTLLLHCLSRYSPHSVQHILYTETRLYLFPENANNVMEAHGVNSAESSFS